MPARKTRRTRAAPKGTLTFLSGGGEMGERMRALDWSATPLGPAAKWPQSLRTTVSLMLTSRYPMFIAWGPELAFLYNDGCRPILGARHPATLGRPFAETCAEVWDDVRPLVERGLAVEESRVEDLPLSSGSAEEPDITFSCSQIRDESGAVGGLFCVCGKSTERVVGEPLLADGRLHLAIEAAHMGVWDLDLRTGHTVWSSTHFELLGYRPRADGLASYEQWRVRVHPDDRARVEGAWQLACDAGTDFAEEYRIVRADTGETRWLSAYGRFVREGERPPHRSVGVFFDVTEKKRVEEALRDSEARFRALADNIPTLCWMADETGWIFWYNSRWYAYTGTTPEQMEGWGWQSVHDPQALPAVVERWKASLASGAPFEMTFPLKGADGVFRPFLTRVAPVRDEAGRVVRWFGTNTDITQQLAAEEALREADERKNEFLAMLAHELRNPLAPLRTMGHVLAHHTTDTETSRRAGQMLHRQVGQLSRLVDDLLDVARITRGTIALRKQTLRLEEIVAGAVESVQPALDVKRQHVKLADAREPLHVDGDAARLAQAIGNLLSNAVKYSPEGSTIHVHVARSDDQAEVRVRDEGVGIEPEVLPQIFDMFFQADRSLDRQQGGLGVGLTIVRKLVELHGGSVEAKSAGRGQGSEFVVRLPLVATRERSDDVHVLPRGSPRRQRVLVVDDNVDAADSLAMMLALAQQEVRTANDGPGALRLLEEFSPDVIFVDIGLPGMDGYHVAREIRGRFTGAPPRLYAITGYGREQDRARALESGFDGHFTKPVDPDALMALITDS